MNILFILLIPFLSALIILLGSNKLSQKLAIVSSVASVVIIGLMLALYGQDTAAISSIDIPWINGLESPNAGDAALLIMVSLLPAG